MKPIQLPTNKTFWNILNSIKDLSAHRAWALALGSSQIPSSRAKVGGEAAGATVTLSSESPESGHTAQPMLSGATLLSAAHHKVTENKYSSRKNSSPSHATATK